MTRLRILVLRIVGSLFKRPVNNDLEQEIGFHIEMESARNQELGMGPEESRQAARRNFGGVDRVKDSYRAQSGLPSIDGAMQDIRYAIRTLVKNPGFACVAIFSLTITIGANTAIFSAVNSLLIRAPYAHSDRLVQVIPWNQKRQEPFPVSFADANDWRTTNIFEDLAVARETNFALTGVSDPQTVFGGTVTANFFRVLGVAPQFGRDFAPDEQRAVILSHSLWQKRFGGTHTALGQTVILNSEACTIIGVLPEDFRSPSPLQELWVAALPGPALAESRAARGGEAFARLRPEYPIGAAQIALQAIADRVAKAYPETNADIGVRVVRQQDYEIEFMGLRPLLIVLTCAGVIVLVVCCVNLANLLLARSSGRSREIAIRTAVGASRARVIRQLIIESLVLVSVGGGLGFLLGVVGSRLLANPPAFYLLYLRFVSVDLSVLAFTAGICVASVVAFGIVPALLTPRIDITGALKSGANAATSIYRSHRELLRQTLIVCQIAASAALVLATALVGGSVARLQNVELGYEPTALLHVRIGNIQRQYRTVEEWLPIYREIINRANALPGVVAVGGSNGVPHGGEPTRPIAIGDLTYKSANDAPTVGFRIIGGEYLTAMRIALKDGRGFNLSDTRESTRVVLINEAMKHRYWPDANPLGERIRIGEPDSRGFRLDGPAAIIVGVVADVRQSETLVAPPVPAVYVPFQQSPTRGMALMVRTVGNPLSVGPALRREIRSISGELLIDRLETMQDRVREATGVPRFALWLMTLLSGIALTLTVIGMYGVISFWIARQKKDIGIRMALGAQPREIVWIFAKRAGLLSAIGLLVGSGIGVALTQLMKSVVVGGWLAESLTFEVHHFETGAVLIAWFMIGLGVILGVWVPIRRASRLDPLATIKYE